MGLTFSKVFGKLFGKKDVRILMVGLDAAGKTTILCARRPASFAPPLPPAAPRLAHMCRPIIPSMILARANPPPPPCRSCGSVAS